MPDRQIHGLARLPGQRQADQRRAQRVRRAGLDRDRKAVRLAQFGRQRGELLHGRDQRDLGRTARARRARSWLDAARLDADPSSEPGCERERRLARRVCALGFVGQCLQLTLETELGVQRLQRGDVAPAVGEVRAVDDDRAIVFQLRRAVG